MHQEDEQANPCTVIIEKWVSVKLAMILFNIGKYPDGFFHIQFMEIKSSAYSNKLIVATGLSQEDVLGYKVEDDGLRNLVQDTRASGPDIGCHLFLENPCHYGFPVFEIGEIDQKQSQ